MHTHTFQATPVPIRRAHSALVFLLLLVTVFPLAFLYLVIPRGQDTEVLILCTDCGEEQLVEQANPCYLGNRQLI